MQVVYDPVLGSLRTSDATGSALTAAPVSTDGNVKLDAASNLYTVKPDSAVTVALDAAAVGSSRFLLALDFSSGVQSVTMPENFRWNGNAPNMSLKGIHTVDVVYMSTDEVNAFTGTYLGRVANPIDPNKGVVTYINGTLKEDWCGEEFNSLNIEANAGWDDDGNEFSETVIVDVNPGSNITGLLELKSYELAALTVNVKGGVVAKISSRVADGTLEFNMTSGVVQDVYWTSSGLSPVTFSMDGGTIQRLTLSEVSGGGINITAGTVDFMAISSTIDEPATIRGGTIGTLVGDYSASVEVFSGGLISSLYTAYNEGSIDLVMSGGTVGTLFVAGTAGSADITGGYIGLITTDSGSFGGKGVVDPTLAGCTVGSIITALNWDDEESLVPRVGKNVLVERWDAWNGEDTTSDTATITVGANSIIKITPAMRSLVDAGTITINADPTAQIINLED